MSFTEETTKALELLTVLAQRDETKLSEVLKKSRALQFCFTNKTGLGLGITTGTGFSLEKLSTKEDGSAEWSAPCFLVVGSLSIGATIGTQDAGALSCMLTDKAAGLLHEHGVLGSLAGEANLTILNFVAEGRSAEVLELADQSALQDVVTLGWQDGILADLSASVGGIKVDSSKNTQVYGGPKDPKDILSSADGAPAPFYNVYVRLNEIMLSQN